MTQDIPDNIQATITAELHRTMRHLLGVDGCSVPAILAVIHAETVVQMTGFFGGRTAAEICDMAARRVVGLPQDSVFGMAMADSMQVMQ